ncbi:MAG: ABC transporter substrate-binding protein [Bacteroidetes bacterium]|nr:ABC transporter substrate-binding protein [Bacteroidota bacterium]
MKPVYLTQASRFYKQSLRLWIRLAFFCVFADCAPAPHIETRTVFRYNQHNPITSLDPAFARTQNNIWAVDCLFNGLVQLNDQLQVEPGIAYRWEICDGGLTYRFWLRNDVFFHNNPCFPQGLGRKLKAEDVVFSFNRLLDSNWPKPGSWIFKDRVRPQNPFVAEQDTVFSLHLKEPFHAMLQILTMQYASIVPKEALDYYGREFRSHPVGTGPFQFKVWEENQALVLVKNPAYFEFDSVGTRLPYLDAVHVRFIGDRKSAFLEFKKHRLDYFYGLESAYSAELLTPEGELRAELSSNFQYYKNPYLNTEYLGFDMQADPSSPFLHKKVRQALNFGIDRETLLRTLRNGVGKSANAGFAPRGLPSFAPDHLTAYGYDVGKARRLLVEAGYPNGKNLPVMKLLCNQEYLDICTFIIRQWEDLGVHVTLEVLETAGLRERMRKGNAGFFRASWIADYPDAESFFTCFYSKNGAPPNYTRFAHAAFDQKYEAALAETNELKRYALYRELDEILIEEAPVVFLFYDETAQFAWKNVSGLPHNAINLLRLKQVKIAR